MRWMNAVVLTVLLVGSGCSHLWVSPSDEPIGAGKSHIPAGHLADLVPSETTYGGVLTLVSVDLPSLGRKLDHSIQDCQNLRSVSRNHCRESFDNQVIRLGLNAERQHIAERV